MTDPLLKLARAVHRGSARKTRRAVADLTRRGVSREVIAYQVVQAGGTVYKTGRTWAFLPRSRND